MILDVLGGMLAVICVALLARRAPARPDADGRSAGQLARLRELEGTGLRRAPDTD